MADKWACLNCGAELEHDWLPCPHCGWQAQGPEDDSSNEPEAGSPEGRFHFFSRRTFLLKVLALGIALVFLFLFMNWVWHIL